MNSTKRRLSGGQNVVRGGSIGGWSGSLAAVIAPDHRFPSALTASIQRRRAGGPAVARAYSTNCDRDAGLDQLGQLRGVPVGQPHAAMAFGLADLGGVGRAVDAVGRLRQRDPDRADRAVGARRDGQDLVVVALLEVEVRIVGVFRIEGDAGDLVGAGRRRRVGRADGGGIGDDQLAGSVIGAHLLLRLVGDDAADRRRDIGAEIGDLDDRARPPEHGVRVERLQIGLVHVEALGQHLGDRGEAQPVELGLVAVVGRHRGDERPGRILRRDRVGRERVAAASAASAFLMASVSVECRFWPVMSR